MSQWRVVVPMAALIVAVLTAGAWAEPVVNPKVVTDQSVDCSSLESIVKGVVKPGMTDQEKAIALYHWFRRVCFHFRCMGADRRDVLRVVNSYGCDLCGSQAAVFRLILNAAGIKARVISGNGGEELGHTVVEAWWDDRWHVFDTMTSFYVLTRGDKPTVASMKDLATDTSLVTKAVAEKRCGPEFLYCLSQTEVDLAKRRLWEANKMLTPPEDIAWTLLVIKNDKDGKPQSTLTFWEKGPRKASANSPDDPGGGKYEPGLLDITLKPNEEYVRLWDNVGKWVKQGAFDQIGPYHTCGTVDEKDPINFKFYEPYRKENVGYAKVAYRYFGNGWLDWQPKPGAVLDAATPVNLVYDAAAGALKAEDPAKPASLAIPVKTGYSLVEALLALDIRKADEKARIAVTFTRNNRPEKKAVEPKVGRVDLVFPNELAGVITYELKVDVTGGAVEFNVAQVKSTFVVNFQSLPHLVPGKNAVTVIADTTALKDATLLVTYEWDEGENWKDGKTDKKELTALPASYTLDVAGPKMPRMKRLVMKVVPNGQ
jgi:hypothetical protein